MTDTPTTDAGAGQPLERVSDLPLVLERMQDTIESLQATVEEQHTTLAAHSRRIAALEQATTPQE